MSTLPRLLTALLCATLALTAGCTRTFWRRQADDWTYDAIREHLDDPRWAVPRIDVTPDPRARFYSSYDPDREPLPPDDPAAHQYIHDLKLFPGAESWHVFGTALSIENPHWLAAFGLMVDPRTGETRPRRQIVHAANEISVPRDAERARPTETESSPIIPASFDATPESGKPADSKADAGDDGASGGNGKSDGSGAAGPSTAGDSYAMPNDDGGGIAPKHIDLPGLRLGEAIELGLIHSREYQTAIEDLYLAALALTFERFRFYVRYLGVANREPSGDAAVAHTPGGDSQFSMNLRGGVRNLLPSGAQWAIELANNTLWVFTAGQSSTASLLSFSLTQPLLRNAGRKVTLENLTQAERDVLYAARTLARFRKEFFVELVGGRSGPGFLGLLELRQTVLNQRNNVDQLVEQAELQRALASQIPSRIVEPLEKLPPGLQIPPDLPLRFDAENRQLVWSGPMSEQQAERLRGLSDDSAFRDAIAAIINRARGEVVTLSVAQLESNLAASRNALRTAQRQFQDALDRYKLQLGLPPDIEITIDESLLEPFRLIDPRLRRVELQLKDFVERWSVLQREPPTADRVTAVGNALLQLVAQLEHDGIALLEEDFANLEHILGLRSPAEAAQPPRRRTFESEAERQRVLNDLTKDRRMFETLRTELGAARRRLRSVLQSAQMPNLPAARLQSLAGELGTLREQFHKIAQGLQVVQIGVRVEQITLEPVQLTSEKVVQLALENRLDLMNQRAMVMDARRKIELAANELKAILDIQVEGDIGTPSGVAPFDFRGSSSNFRAGLAFDAPLDKVFQRNAYRAALIDYQRARRAYMAFEDQIKLQVRQEFRSLLIARRNFENARQAVRIAALQLDSAVEQATAPVQTGGQNQGLNLLNALRDVLNAQNDLIRFWVRYEQARLNLFRDMGLMEIDEEGVWTDPFYQQQTARRRWSTEPGMQNPGSTGPHQTPAVQRASTRKQDRPITMTHNSGPRPHGTAIAEARRELASSGVRSETVRLTGSDDAIGTTEASASGNGAGGYDPLVFRRGHSVATRRAAARHAPDRPQRPGSTSAPRAAVVARSVPQAAHATESRWRGLPRTTLDRLRAYLRRTRDPVQTLLRAVTGSPRPAASPTSFDRSKHPAADRSAAERFSEPHGDPPNGSLPTTPPREVARTSDAPQPPGGTAPSHRRASAAADPSSSETRPPGLAPAQPAAKPAASGGKKLVRSIAVAEPPAARRGWRPTSPNRPTGQRSHR